MRGGCFMGPEIRNDLPAVQQTLHRQNHGAPKTSGNDATVRRVNEAADAVAANKNDARVPAEYANVRNRRALENDLDSMLKLIFPDLGVRFRIHESGNIITNIIDNATDEIVREFPAEKILDLIHSMTQRIGTITNRRI
jgi:uncharacterized FlaG/YvyC family protein